MKDVDVFGEWWTPENPQKRFAGRMSFSHESGIELEIVTEAFQTSFRGSSGQRKAVFWLEGNHEIEIVLGYADGKRITLFNCSFSPLGKHARADFAFIGAHFKSPNDLMFNRIGIQYSNQDAWFEAPTLVTDLEQEDGSHQIKRATIVFTPRAPSEFQILGDNVQVYENWGLSHNARNAGIESSTIIDIRLSEEMTLETIETRYLKPLQDLISFGADLPIFIQNLDVFSTHAMNVANKSNPLPIKVLAQIPGRRVINSEFLTPSKMLFTFMRIKTDFAATLERWFEVRERLGAIIHLFLGVQYQLSQISHTTDQLLQQQFLSLVRALEAYHRHNKDQFEQHELPEEVYNNRIENIISQVPSDQQEWVRGQFGFAGNRRSLRNRIMDLLGANSQAMRVLIQDFDSFAKKVAKARNDLAHQNEGVKAVKPIDWWLLIWRLYVLMQLLLLGELGFSQDDSTQLLADYERYKFLIASFDQ